jgi:hypothetical protein
MSRACCKTTRRGGEIAGWIIPTATLALLPKCPACLVGYIAVATGMGISFTAAKYLRFGLIALSVLALAFFSVRCVATWRARKVARQD